jgi:hypothetical protein
MVEDKGNGAVCDDFVAGKRGINFSAWLKTMSLTLECLVEKLKGRMVPDSPSRV